METLATLMEKRYGSGDVAGDATPAQGTLAQILARRSVRRYRDAPVPAALLEALLACAQSAPTKSNLQQYSIVVVEDAALRRRLAALCPQTGWLATSPVFLVFCADIRRGRRIAAMRGYAHANDNMDTFLNAAADAALALGFFVVAAEAAGLGCVPISEVRNRIEEVSAALALPDGVFPLAGLTAGWPADAGYINQRLAPSVVIHRDRYDDSGLEAAVAAYDRMRHAIYPLPPDKQRHADRYGVAELCTWSENAARQLSVPERAGFRAFLEAHGFALA